MYPDRHTSALYPARETIARSQSMVESGVTENGIDTLSRETSALSGKQNYLFP